MKEMNVFKLSYQWYEGEYQKTLLAKNVSKKGFEKDLTEARNFAKSLIGKEVKNSDFIGKGYSVECLPEYYDQIVWFLVEKKGYLVCDFDQAVEYFVDDCSSERGIEINKKVQKTEWQDLVH